MSDKPFLAGRIPVDLHKALLSNSKETGTTKTEVMIAALRQYLDCPQPVETTSEDIARLEELIEGLQKSFSKLEKKVLKIENQKTFTPPPKEESPIFHIENDNSGSKEKQKAQSQGKQKSSLPRYTKSESEMARLSNKDRNVFRKYRKSIKGEVSKKPPQDVLELVIKGEEYVAWIWEVQPRGKLKTYIWAANPKQLTV